MDTDKQRKHKHLLAFARKYLSNEVVCLLDEIIDYLDGNN